MEAVLECEIPRVRLRDGRFLAYKEAGVAKHVAEFKVIVVHGLGGSRSSLFPCSQKLMEELGVYLVGYDRAGYGYSDPFPNRSVESEAFDIQDLADALQLGPKFYVLAISIGGYSAWACLKCIPHRLAGVAMVAPAVNYWWPSLPSSLASQAFQARSFLDRCSLRIAHYVPWLHHRWTSQKWLSPDISSKLDKQDRRLLSSPRLAEIRAEAQRQGTRESTSRDILVQFSNWKFDPARISKPGENIPVHIWQGDRDYLVPASLQHCIHEKLTWTEYHEVSGAGHLFFLLGGHGDEIIQKLLQRSS